MSDLFKNILLYLSAFVPMYFLIQVKVVADLLFGNIKSNLFTYVVLIIFAALIVLGILGLVWNILWNRDKSENIVIRECNNITDQHFLGYFSIFVLFSLGFDLTRMSMFVVFIFILTFVGIVYINNKLFYINPFLNILGFNFYEVTYESATKTKTVKLFYRGKLEVSPEPRCVIVKNEYFGFVDRKNDTKHKK